MKIYLHYCNDQIYLSVVENIAQADALFKDAGLKPLEFITTGLALCSEEMFFEETQFSGLLKNACGSVVVDDFGKMVRYCEMRLVGRPVVTKKNIATQEELLAFNTKELLLGTINYLQFGDKQKLPVTIYCVQGLKNRLGSQTQPYLEKFKSFNYSHTEVIELEHMVHNPFIKGTKS